MYDYEDYKTLDCYDISRYCRVGENQIDIHIWFWGEETLNYRKSSAGLYFEITENGKTIAASDEEVLCKYSESYKQHKRQMITSAQGYTFWYDNTTEALPFVQKSVIVEKKLYLLLKK